ncbi:MAG: hypothetical protein NT062_32200, partial [Proteobacteria bacterium]|nr:hypothetical protein [Pseudomonadota bacterium]
SFMSTTALARALRPLAGTTVASRRLFALEAAGWVRGPVQGGAFGELVRTLHGTTCTLTFAPGVQLNRGMAQPQTIRTVRVKGGSSRIAFAELARELASLA